MGDQEGSGVEFCRGSELHLAARPCELSRSSLSRLWGVCKSSNMCGGFTVVLGFTVVFWKTSGLGLDGFGFREALMASVRSASGWAP